MLTDDGLYRYRLERAWGTDGTNTVLFVMLNPSTADALEDDPTVRRCMGFAAHLDCARLLVGNLFAWRATDPRELQAVARTGKELLVGPENDAHLARMRDQADITVFAWGAHGARYPWRVAEVERLFREDVAYHLGRTNGGQPRHPLMLGYEAGLQGMGRYFAAV